MKKILLLTLVFTFTVPSYSNPLDWCTSLFRPKSLEEVAQPNAFARAFDDTTVTEGSVVERAHEIANKWPDNVKVVDDVTMKFSASNDSGQQTRKMLVISLDGLDDDQSKALLRDYTDYMSHKTISFPLNEGGGHLHTRLGTKDIDVYGSYSENAYRWPSSERLETFVSLTDDEFANVKQYVDNISVDKSKVLGSVDYDGIKREISGGTIGRNKPSSGGHNCTSWIGLAPIGENRSSLRHVVGAHHEYHTNPGWWTAYLQTKAPSDKVPVVAYITTKNMDDALAKATADSFEWNYSLH